MKKIICLLLALVMTVGILCSCEAAVNRNSNDEDTQASKTQSVLASAPATNNTEPTQNDAQNTFSYEWESTYYIDNSDKPQGNEFPIVIRSVKELEESGYAPYSKGYDDAFFEENTLLVVVCVEPSFHWKHTVLSFTKTNDLSYLLVIMRTSDGPIWADEFSCSHSKVFIEVHEIISEDAVIELHVNPSSPDEVQPVPDFSP